MKTKSKPRVETGVRLIERTPATPEMRVDRDAGVIYGVKIVGHKSKWGHEYEQSALREAVPLYEKRPVNIDHHVPKSATDFRKFDSGFGEIRNVRAKPDGLYGDVHYLKTHPLADMVAERAERFPRTMGMSHDAIGNKVHHPDGHVTIDKIAKVKSVDLVCEGATTDGLFEAAPIRPIRQATVVESSPTLSDVPSGGTTAAERQRWLQH